MFIERGHSLINATQRAKTTCHIKWASTRINSKGRLRRGCSLYIHECKLWTVYCVGIYHLPFTYEHLGGKPPRHFYFIIFMFNQTACIMSM